jgi:hypothetical protein
MRLHFASVAVALTASLTALVFTEGLAQAADPTTADCLAASDASLKLGNDHKLRAERSQLLVCAASTCPADIRKECLSRVDEVNAQIPTIVFSAKDPKGADLSAVNVKMDGEVVAERLEGTALSIDPGEHTFTFETAGQSPVTKKLVIVEGQKDRREVINFGSDLGGATGGPSSIPPTGADESHGIGTQKILAMVAGGIGILGFGVGTAFGVMALSKKSDAQNACPNQCATQDGVNKWSDAESTGNVSTIALIVGGVGVAGGAVLWFTAPSATSSSTQVGVGLSGLQVKGTW